MDEQNETTKEKILRAAARLFSESGYDKVTTREIANAIGINSASIYYHFTSKDEILKSLYRFYTEVRSKTSPDKDELLRLAETEYPHAVLMKSEFHFDEEYRGMLDHIIATAVREINADPEAERFIGENIFDSVTGILKPLLERFVELGKIKPFDIDTFLRVLSNYCFSTAALNNSSFRQDVRQYQEGMAFLFSMITTVEDN